MKNSQEISFGQGLLENWKKELRLGNPQHLLNLFYYTVYYGGIYLVYRAALGMYYASLGVIKFLKTLPGMEQ